MLRNAFRQRTIGLWRWVLLFILILASISTNDIQAVSNDNALNDIAPGDIAPGDIAPSENTPSDNTVTDKILILSMATGGKVGTLQFGDEDILLFNTTTGKWSTYFDGSDLGLRANDVDGFKFYQNGEMLLSFSEDVSLPELGMVHDEDIVKFIPTSLGITTAGRYEWFLDGSDVGLTGLWDDIDLIAFTPDGRLVVSTRAILRIGDLSVKDEDLIVLNDANYGEASAGSWALYFDGSDVELNQNNDEDVKGLWIDPGNNDLYLTVSGVFSTTTLTGNSSDIFVCTPLALGTRTACSFRPFWHGADYSLAGEQIDDLIILDSNATIPNATLIKVGDQGTETDDPPDEGDPDEGGELDISQQLFLPMAGR